MDHFYPLKTALSILFISLICIESAFANNSFEHCGLAGDSISINSDHGRYTIEIGSTLESIIISDLEPGKTYNLWISSPEVSPECIFDLSKENPKQSDIIEGNSTLEFKAAFPNETIYIQNANCTNSTTYFADLTISKKETEAQNELLKMMGIMTDPNFTAQQLIEDILIGGGCFDVSNVQLIGNAQGTGFFSSGASSISMDEGIILASGNIGNSAGPNNATNITTNFFDTSGDQDLDILSTAGVFDAVGIEFDFTPVVNTIQFNYVFASDEYCDYVNTTFNDAFGFFISGPGFNGPYSGNGENIALVPGTNDDVAINSVNIQSNSAYYVDNVPIGQNQLAGGCVAADLDNPGAAETEIEYDGFTTVLTATANVQVCETYHIRLVVGDVNDGIFDSAVFLEANSFDLGGDVSLDVDLPGLESSGVAYEGCSGDGFIIFERPADADLTQPYTVFFNISPASTATNGADFSTLPPSITIPAGQTQFLLPLSIYDDLLTEGTEVLILELDNPCTCDDASIEIQIADVPPMVVTTTDVMFCNETSTMLFADVGGGVPGYTYQWSTGGTGPTITVDAMTGIQTYDVTVTDICGNIEMSTVTVSVAEEAFAVIEGFVEVCEGNPTGFLTISFIGDGPWDLTYLIDGVPQNPIIGITENPYILSVSEPGVYTIGGIFVDGCPGIGDGSGIVLPTIFNSFVLPTDLSCPENFDGAIDLLVTGGAPAYAYEWSNDIYTEDQDNLGPGTYTVTVTDLNGCTHIDSTTVAAPPEIEASAVELQGVSCLDSLSGSANLTVSGGNPDYTYLWDNGSTIEDPTDLTAGPHTVTVTDSLGCISEAMVTIGEDFDPPVAEAEVSGILTCDEIEIFINGGNSSGADSLSYVWLDGNGEEVSTDTLTSIFNPGSYTLIVTNLENGCSDETTVTVDQDNTPPSPNATGGTINCDETEVVLNATGSSGVGTLGYSWVDENGEEVGTTDTLSVMEAGTYTLIITDDSNGCTAETTTVVDLNNDVPTPVADPSGILNCDDLTINIDGAGSSGTGTISYQWLDENGELIGEEVDIDVNDPGEYVLIITDSENGCTAETTALVEQNMDEPNPDAIADGLLNCNNSSVLLNGVGSTSNGTITYQWLDNGSEIGVESEVEVTGPGTYTLIVTDSESGCTAATEVTVEEDMDEPNPDAIADMLTCDILMVTLDGSGSTGTGNIAYEWLDENGELISNDPTFDIEDAGIYTLIITDDSNGCTAETTVEVDQDIQEPNADAGDGGMLDCNDSEVILNANGSSGTGTLTYVWLDGNGSEIGDEVSVTVEEAGTYTVIITDDSNGCTSEATVEIEQNEDLPSPEANPSGLLTCDEMTINIDGAGSSGTGTITYQWFDENGEVIGEEVDIDVADPGEYILIITDSENGCTAETTALVEQNTDEPNPDAIADGLIDCINTTVLLDGSGSSSNGGLTYQWLENGTEIGVNSEIEVTESGTYTLIVTDDASGCTAETEVIVDADENLPTPEATNSGILTCDSLTVTLDGSTSSGTGTISYEWLDESGDFVSNDPDFQVISTGTFTLIITDDENGCTAETTVDVDQDIQPPVADAGDNGMLNCDETEAQLNGDGSSQGNNISYEWINAADVLIGEDISIQVGEAGTYILIVTNTDNGCTAISEVTIDTDDNVPDADAEVQGIINCNENIATLDGSTSSGNGTLSYQWLDENGEEIAVAPTTDVTDPGIYTLVILDTDNGCSAQATVEVLEDMVDPEPEILDPALLDCIVTSVNLDASNSNGGGVLNYQWEDADGINLGATSAINVTDPGTYFLVITDTGNGCTSQTSIDVEESMDVPIPDATVDGVLTCETLNVVLDGSNSTGLGALLYEWLDENNTPISSSVSTEISSAGTYTLIVTDTINGCESETTVIVDQNIIDPQADAITDGLLNCEVTSVLLDGSNSTGENALNYQWLDENGEVVAEVATLDAAISGTYTLIVTDQVNGCTNETTVEVDENMDTPQPDAIADGLLTCENLSVMLDGSGSSSTGALSFEWFDESTISIGVESTLDVEATGTYTLIITDQLSACTESITVDVDENILEPASNAGPQNILDCDTETVMLDGSNSSTGNNISYEWINTGGVTVSEEITAEVDQAGTYTLIVTNTDNGCTSASTVDVVPDANLPDADAGLGTVLTCDILEATLSGISSSSGGNISYQWLDPNDVFITNELEIVVNLPGTYTLIVTDNDNGCSATSSVEVDENIIPPAVDPGNNPTLTCDETEVLLDGSGSTAPSGNLSYEWFDENGISLGTDSVVMVEMAGIYSLTITAENGCTNSADVEVFLDADVPVADPGTNGTLDCNVSVITLGGTNTTSGSGITYQWLNSNNVIVGEEPTLDVDLPDTYTLFVFNSNNDCETSAQAIVDENILAPLADAGGGGMLTCETTEIILGGSTTSTGAIFEYEWTDIDDALLSTDSAFTISTPGTYTITVFNTENGCTTSEVISIDQDIIDPVANAGPGGILTCDVTEITLDGSGSSGDNLSYQWLNEAGVLVDVNTQIQVSETGVYTLVVTNDVNGCTASNTVEVVPDENIPTAIATELGILTCDNDEVLIDAGNSSSISGNLSYEWLDPNNVFLSNDTSLLVNTPGVYSVIITDTDNGCTTTALVDVPQNIDMPQAFAGDNDTLTCSITSLDLIGSATNGTNFFYEWFDENNLSIGQTPTVAVEVAGVYTLVVINQDNGCSSSADVAITPDTDLPVAAAGLGGTLTCVTGSILLDASGSEQGPDINYEWQDPNGVMISDLQQIEVYEPGIYTIIVTDAENNCVAQDIVNIAEDINDPLAAIDGIGPIELNCDINAVILNGENSMPFPDLSFDWSTSNGNITTATDIFEIGANQPGVYVLTVTNEVNGCVDTQTYTVNENVEPPSAFINAPPIITCYNSEVDVLAVNTSGNGNFGYTWTAANGSGIVDGETTLELIVNQSGTYILTIENMDNGCDETVDVFVDADLESPDAIANSEDELDCVTESVEVSGLGSSTGTIYNYQWQGSGIITSPNALDISVNQAGVYQLVVTNIENGCSEATDVIVLENDDTPNSLDFAVVPPLCPGDYASIEILNVEGGEEPYVYSIDGGENFYDITLFFGIDPGSYDVVVQDAIGCEYEEFVDIPFAQPIFLEVTTLNLEIQLGDTVQLNGFVNVPESSLSLIQWTPGNSLSCDTCLNTIAYPNETTTYHLRVENANGCPAEDEITLKVKKDRGIFIPNVFSPLNEDGINDIFHVFSDGKTVENINTFQIFDRWGELVFENENFLPDDPANGWDGMLRGEPMNPQVFVYWAEITFIDGAVILYKGDVTLVR